MRIIWETTLRTRGKVTNKLVVELRREWIEMGDQSRRERIRGLN